MYRPYPSQSVRLRGALWNAWNAGVKRKMSEDAETYYCRRMDEIIESVVKELTPPTPNHEYD